MDKKSIIIWTINYKLAENYISQKSYTFIQKNITDEIEICTEIESAHILIVGRNINISTKTIAKLKNCLAIIRPGVGSDNIEIEQAKTHNISVYTIPDYCIDEVADHTLALLLSYTRKIMASNKLLTQDLINNWNVNLLDNIVSLRNKVIGIIGMGYIGQAVAVRAKAFNLRVIYYDPYIKRGMDKILNCRNACSLEQLVAESMYISIHTPLTHETKYMINESLVNNFNVPKVIINSARGKIISNDVIYQGLKNGKIEAYLADVLEFEPPSLSHPLFQSLNNKEDWLENRLIITPHIAFYSQESQKEVIKRTFEIIDLLIESNLIINN